MVLQSPDPGRIHQQTPVIHSIIKLSIRKEIHFEGQLALFQLLAFSLPSFIILERVLAAICIFSGCEPDIGC